MFIFNGQFCVQFLGVTTVYLADYANPRESRNGLTRYFNFYNHERPHQALGYRTPAQLYFGKER